MLEHASRSELAALLKRKLRETASKIRRDRISLVGLGFHWPNAVLTHGFHSVLGYNPIRLALYTKATGAGDTIGLPEQRAFAPLFNSYRCRLADLLGLRYIVTGVPIEQLDKSLKPRDLVEIAKTSDGIVYENPRAMARVLFANSAVTADFDITWTHLARTSGTSSRSIADRSPISAELRAGCRPLHRRANPSGHDRPRNAMRCAAAVHAASAIAAAALRTPSSTRRGLCWFGAAVDFARRQTTI